VLASDGHSVTVYKSGVDDSEPRIRRCTFRRLISVESTERIYDVECLYPERRVPIPLGDLESALPICNACTAAHIFRPDED